MTVSFVRRKIANVSIGPVSYVTGCIRIENAIRVNIVYNVLGDLIPPLIVQAAWALLKGPEENCVSETADKNNEITFNRRKFVVRVAQVVLLFFNF